jgi:glycerol-3-phosphate O-acyltransferase
MRREVESSRLTERKAIAKARNYANEIAADYNYTTVRVLERVLTWLWDRLYDGVEVGHLDRLKSVVEGNEIIYVPCHRSHIDYLLLSYVVYRNGLVPPHIAAGLNLNLPVVGPILRRGGAFFMRRSFRDNGYAATSASPAGRSCSCPCISATSVSSRAAPTSRSCPADPSRRSRSSAW